MQSSVLNLLEEPNALWHRPLEIMKSGFKHKGLSAWSANLSIGCSHGCRFCYVPSVSTGKQRATLEDYGVSDPKDEWGGYMIPRTWDIPQFRKSLKKAMAVPEIDLPWDGHRAVMFSTTTDPFMVSRHPDPKVRKTQSDQLEVLFCNSLEMIRDESDLNVRILTRSPLAEKHFELMKSLGDRLLFGMSLPSLDDELVRKYEPKAPGVEKRLECLRAAAEFGLNVYVAVAPTFPEQSIDDYGEILSVINLLNPVSVFHEPINIRGSNVKLMQQAFEADGHEFQSSIFEDRGKWAVYAAQALTEFEIAAGDAGLSDQLKLWPDEALLNKSGVKAVPKKGIFASEEKFTEWVQSHWDKPSSWPGE